MTRKVSGWSQRSRSNILKICHMVRNMNSSFIVDGWRSYLAQELLLVCRLQRRFQITDMTFVSISNIQYTSNMSYDS